MWEDEWRNSSTHFLNQLFFTKHLLWTGYCVQCWGYNKCEIDVDLGLYEPYGLAVSYNLPDTITQAQVHMLLYNMRCDLQN